MSRVGYLKCNLIEEYTQSKDTPLILSLLTRSRDQHFSQ